jgi:hypothetical protein
MRTDNKTAVAVAYSVWFYLKEASQSLRSSEHGRVVIIRQSIDDGRGSWPVWLLKFHVQ